ncbi:SOS response-associated peptidase family protein [Oxalobacteraceae bacterium]|nr:SOS response-associated peptidase family protein [Oxalobacteraceae bacterium]
MCINFRPPDPEMLAAVMGILVGLHELDWKTETWKDYPAPIVRRGADGGREGVLATYGLVPRKRQRPGNYFDTLNARSETIGELHWYKGPWKQQQLCLVPMTAFYEPSYEKDESKAEWWGIGMEGKSMFAVAGMWRSWDGDAGLETSFTQLTMNADSHSLMKRFHGREDEKRMLVILPESDWDEWLNCRDPEFARSFIRHFPAELMVSREAPRAPRAKKPKAATAPVPAPPKNLDFGF